MPKLKNETDNGGAPSGIGMWPPISTWIIDLFQQEIYSYIDSLEQRDTWKIVESSSNREEILNEGIHFDPLEEPKIVNTLKQ